MAELEIFNPNTTKDVMIVYRKLDIVLSTICMTVFVVGVPGNIAALFHFMSRGRDLPTRLYTLLSLIDAMLCIFIFPVGLSFAYHRDPMMFSWPVFCTLWGAVWTWAPYMSVFLIAVLSITRTLVLLNPLRTISKTKVIVVVVFYGIWIAIRMATPMVVEGPTFHYLNKSVECMWMSERELLNEMSLITVIIFLANPVVPILVSCGISTYVIMASIHMTSKSATSGRRKRRATVTILILTATYLLLNFPLFIYLAGFTYYYISHKPHEWLDGSVTLDNYLWNLVYIVLIGVNSLGNFVVYFFRIRQFRAFLCQWLARGRSNVVQQLSPVLSSLHDAVSPKPIPKMSNGSSFHSTVSNPSRLSRSVTSRQRSVSQPDRPLTRRYSLAASQRNLDDTRLSAYDVLYSRGDRLLSADSVESDCAIIVQRQTSTSNHRAVF